MKKAFLAISILAAFSAAAAAAEPAEPAPSGLKPAGDAPKPASLEDVVVSPSRTILGDPVSEKDLLASEALKLPLIDNDLMRAVQQHPGVTGNDFTGRFGVRGGDVDETAVVVDGMELYQPFHLQDFGGALSILDLLAVSRATLYLGAAPAELGDGLSGVLDVRLKAPPGEARCDMGVDVLNAHVFAGAKPFLAAARAGYIGLLMGIMDSEEVFEPHYGDVLLRYADRLSASDEISVNALYAVDVNRIDNAGQDDDLRSRFHNLSSWAKWVRKLGARDRIEFLAYGGGYSQWRRGGAGGRDDRDLAYGGGKVSLSFEPAEGLLVKAGADVRWMKGEYDYFDPHASVDLDADETGVLAKAYASATWRVAPFLTAEFGGRLLYLSTIGATDFGPMAAVSVEGGNGVSLRAACGLYYQPVDPLHVPVETGSKELAEPERAFHGLFGAQFKSREAGVNARAELYYKEMDRLAGFVRDFGSKTRVYEPSDRGASWGLELSLDKTVGKAALHAAFTYSFSREKSGSEWFFTDRDQRYAFQAGASAVLGFGWSVYASWRYHSGNPYTPMFVEDGALVEGPRNSCRLPPYHSLDIRLTRAFRWQGMDVRFYAQVLNAYNRMNVHEYYVEEKTVDGETVFERRNEYLFPILPTLGLEISF